MICEACGKEMKVYDTLKRGRHETNYYICSKCGYMDKEKGNLIPNNFNKRK